MQRRRNFIPMNSLSSEVDISLLVKRVNEELPYNGWPRWQDVQSSAFSFSQYAEWTEPTRSAMAARLDMNLCLVNHEKSFLADVFPLGIHLSPFCSKRVNKDHGWCIRSVHPCEPWTGSVSCRVHLGPWWDPCGGAVASRVTRIIYLQAIS